MGKIKIKATNINFILMMVVIILLVLFAFIMWDGVNAVEADLTELKYSMENTMDQDEIGDVEGYGLIVSGIGYTLGSIGMFFIEIFFVIIPLLFAIYMLIFTVIGRIVYAPTKKRLLAYRILMGFDYVGLIALWSCIFSFSSLLLESDSVSILVETVIVELFLLLILFINMRNTYSARIKNENIK